MAACRPYLKFEAHECENNHTGGRGGLDTGKLLKAFNWDVMLAKGSSRRTCQIICACMSWSIPLISGQIENNLRIFATSCFQAPLLSWLANMRTKTSPAAAALCGGQRKEPWQGAGRQGLWFGSKSGAKRNYCCGPLLF